MVTLMPAIINAVAWFANALLWIFYAHSHAIGFVSAVACLVFSLLILTDNLER